MQIIEALFGVPWDELERSHVEAFLRTAGDEGLTWEVKGDRDAGRWPRSVQIEKAVCGFANSQLGGVLVIGAERDNRKKPGWVLAGLDPPNEEVRLAIGRVIRTGVQPCPVFRIKSWPTTGGKQAAVVWVEPVDRPPSITRDGRVFERTTGATEPVKDPAMLSRLFAAGEQVTSRAEALAQSGASRALSMPKIDVLNSEGLLDWWNEAPNTRAWLGIGVGATSYEGDIGGKLYLQSFIDQAEKLIKELLRCAPLNYPLSDQFFVTPLADVVVARIDPANASDHRRHYFVSLGWDGGVGISCLELEGSSPRPPWHEEVLKPMWDLASRLALLLGGSGQLHMALYGSGPMGGGQEWPSGEHARQACLDLVGDEESSSFEVPADLVDQVVLQLRRFAGEAIWS